MLVNKDLCSADMGQLHQPWDNYDLFLKRSHDPSVCAVSELPLLAGRLEPERPQAPAADGPVLPSKHTFRCAVGHHFLEVSFLRPTFISNFLTYFLPISYLKISGW